MCVTRISLGLINGDCRSAIDLEQEALLLCTHTGMGLFITIGWLMKFMPRPGVSLVSEAWDVLMNAQSPHKWSSTLKSGVFGSS